MTTRVLVANFGPDGIEVDVMEKSRDPLGIHATRKTVSVNPQESYSEYVYDTQYLVIKEVTRG